MSNSNQIFSSKFGGEIEIPSPTLLDGLPFSVPPNTSEEQIEITKAVCSGAKSVFKDVTNRDVKDLQFDSKGKIHTYDNLIVATMNMRVNDQPYLIELNIPSQSYLRLITSIVGDQQSSITDDNIDWVAEILNMISNHIAIYIRSKKNWKIDRDIPAVVGLCPGFREVKAGSQQSVVASYRFFIRIIKV